MQPEPDDEEAQGLIELPSVKSNEEGPGMGHSNNVN